MSWTSRDTNLPIPGPTNEGDSFNGADASGDVANGLGGDDILNGNGGDDSLEGGAGFDLIFGGEGNDSITDSAGGGGFFGEGGNDTIAVTLDGAFTGFFPPQAYGGADNDLITVSGPGLTGYYGPDQRLGIQAYGEDGDDTLIGGDANDNLQGGTGDDSINGGEGNNFLFGGEGNDTITAGVGNDSIFADNSGSADPGNDSVIAGDGDDTVYSYDGTDTLDGGAGTDFVSIDRSTAVADLSFTVGPDATLVGDGTIARNFEKFVIATGRGNDTLVGGDGNDQFTGNGGDDQIDGGAGDDIIYGDDPWLVLDGNDTLAGGAGYDQIYGGRGNDSITDSDGGFLSGGDGNDTIAVTLDGAWNFYFPTAYGGADNDLITISGPGLTGYYGPDQRVGIQAGGEDGNDTLLGGDANDNLQGGTGDDSINGGEGNNFLFGGEGNDTITAGVGNDIIYGGAGAGEDGDDSLAGGAGDDTIYGDAGNDSIAGGDGNDILNGGAGNDRFAGGAGDDRIDGGDQSVFGGEGDFAGYIHVSDLVTYANAGAGISFSLTNGDGTVVGAATGEDTLRNIEQVVGSAHHDIMEMQWNAPQTIDILMAGGDGDDRISLVGEAAGTLDGGEGDDTLSGGDGNDTILGGGGNDLVFGGAGDDSIVATPGNDTVEGGPGNDVIDTGDGDDLVIWNIGDGNDVIAMGAGNDTLVLQGWTGDDNDFWTVLEGGAGAIYTYDDGKGNVFTLTTSGVETVVCFTTGTLIQTAHGEVPVERLRAGDLVVSPGAGAPLKPVRWVGRMRVEVARHRNPEQVAPVLIRAGALGRGMPARDLRVSPDHALLLGGRLVPARLLIDGHGIVQERWHRQVTYWHVELDAHGILVAEGALAESYFDDGNRALFDNGVVALHLDPGAGRAGGRYAVEACAPPILSAEDPALAAIRAALPGPPRQARRA